MEVPQQQIDAYFSWVDSAVSRLKIALKEESDAVLDQLTSHASLSFKTRGNVCSNSEEACKILHMKTLFTTAVRASNIRSVLLSFAAEVTEQINLFRQIWNAVDSTLKFTLTKEDEELLIDQSVRVLAALERRIDFTGAQLQVSLSRSIGGTTYTQLIKDVTKVVRKISDVEPIAKDGLVLWFRLLGHLAYTNIDKDDSTLEYTYVGRGGSGKRVFCSNMLKAGPMTRKEIDSFDNQQVGGAFINAGGYGCEHFWLGERK